MRLKSKLIVAGLISGVMIGQAAQASHYRGGAIVSSVDANGLVSFTSTTFWRRLPSPTQGFPVSGTSANNGEGGFTLNGGSIGTGGGTGWIAGTRATDLSDARFAKVTETYQYQLTGGAGTYTFEWSSCCHVGGIANASGGEDLDTTIVWDGQNANTPILFDISNINPEVIRGQAYSDNLGAVSGSGHTLSYDTALSTGMTSQPPGYGINAGTGQVTISAAGTAAMTNENSGNNIGADYAFSGNINASDGSSVEFEWLFDAVNQGSGNQSPNVIDAVVNVFLGDTMMHTMQGSDPDGDPLTWNLQAFFGPGINNPLGFNPGTQLASWDTTGSALGTYTALIRASDGLLTDVGTLTINVLPRQGPVPEPTTLALLGLGMFGMGFARRRKRS